MKRTAQEWAELSRKEAMTEHQRDLKQRAVRVARAQNRKNETNAWEERIAKLRAEGWGRVVTLDDIALAIKAGVRLRTVQTPNDEPNIFVQTWVLDARALGMPIKDIRAARRDPQARAAIEAAIRLQRSAKGGTGVMVWSRVEPLVQGRTDLA